MKLLPDESLAGSCLRGNEPYVLKADNEFTSWWGCSFLCLFICPSIHPSIHTHTHTHTHIHSYTHTHTNKHTVHSRIMSNTRV